MRIDLLVLGLIPVFLAMAIYSNTVIPAISTMQLASSPDSLTYKGIACTYYKAMGSSEWTELGCKDNLITDTGKDFVKNDLSNRVATNITVNNLTLANCTTAQSASQTLLCGGQEYDDTPNCGFTSQLGVYISRGTGNWSHSAVWTSTCASVIVNATGLNNNSNVNQLFAQANFTTVTLGVDDQLNVTYYTWVT